jgi:dihydroorotate dehydrogenase
MSMYRFVYWLLLSRLPAEAAHHLGFFLLKLLMALPGVRALYLRRRRPPPELAVEALGLRFPGPLGLAAGFDKDARGADDLAALGFGFVEVGTVTAEAQPGNPKPRLFRLLADQALVNRMGFNNHGARAAAGRLARRRRELAVVGANIGKTKRVAEADALADYVASARALGPHADYLVVNVSSPNTPGLRDLQAVDKLAPILRAVRAALDQACPGRRVPLLCKIAPDLADADVDAVADLALELGLDGLIATNTTIARAGLTTPAAEVAALGAGGLSGPPLRARSLAVLARLRARVGDHMCLVAAGGITTVDDAWDRLAAGATLLQAYTAFIYQGPSWPARLQRELADRLRERGLTLAQLRARSPAPDARHP